MDNKKESQFIKILTYMLIFCIFMGSNFLKFNIFDTNLNAARIMMVIVSIVYVLGLIKKTNMNINNKSVKWCIVFFIVWSIWSVISIYKSLDIKMYLIMNFYICIGTVNILFFIKYIDLEKHKVNIFNIIIISVFINCLYYIFLYFIMKKDVGGLYYNPNDLATILTLAIPIIIYMIFYEKKIIDKIIYGIILSVYIFTFANIMSRGCVLGVVFAVISMTILVIVKNRKKLLHNKKVIILLIVISLVSIIIGRYVWIHYVGKIDLSPIENAKTSNEVRVNLIYNGIHFLRSNCNWLLGIGAGNNIYYLQNYSVYTTHEIYNFHNFWMDLIVEYGALIFIGFIVTYLTICKELYKKSENNFFKNINTVFLFFLLSFMVSSISSSSIITREWLWLTFAIIISYINKSSSTEK